MGYDVVIPSAGRPALERTLMALGAGDGPLPGRVLVVDDRPAGGRTRPLVPGRALTLLDGRVELLDGPARGPAAARNVGWRASTATWICFLDDDTVPGPGWRAALARDLAEAGPDVGALAGRLRVPLPADRAPTDWERDVAGLEGAFWATADMAYRRSVLALAGGFDERFGRAYREDADLALRTLERGFRLERGTRVTTHPVGPSDPWVSVRRQRGNRDDRLMDALHGPGWRERAQAPRGRLAHHLATVGAGALALGAGAAALVEWRLRHTYGGEAATRRPGGVGRAARGTAVAAGALWAAQTGEFAWRRIAPGPRSRDEVLRMLATSAAIPPVAVWHAATGRLAAPRLARADHPLAPRPLPRAVLLDRDGTLVRDVPYNGDPERVELLDGVREGLDRLRAAGLRLGVVSNQSGIARGLLTERDVAAVNARVEALAGPIDAWVHCPHGPEDGCACRKPAPGMVHEAGHRLGVAPAECALIGDIAADVGAARAAGARPIMVPTPVTRPEEVLAAPEVAASFAEAVDLVLGTARRPATPRGQVAA